MQCIWHFILLQTLVVCVVFACHHADTHTYSNIDKISQTRELTKSGQALQAMKKFENMLKQSPDNLALHRGLVEAAYYAGCLDKVSTRYQKMAKNIDQQALGHYGLALIAVARGPGYMQTVLSEFEHAEKLMPYKADIPYRIGLVYFMNAQYQKACNSFERALDIDTNCPGIQIAYADSLVHLGQENEAVDALRPIVRQTMTQKEANRARSITAKIFDPSRNFDKEASFEVNKAIEYLESDAVYPALSLLSDLEARFPETAYIQVLKGLAHSRLENNGQAIAAFVRALELRPQNPLALVSLGDVYLRLKKWNKARKYYEQAVTVDPLFIEGYEHLGELALSLSDTKHAIRAFEIPVVLDPNNIIFRYKYAQVLSQAGQINEAVGVYETILQLDDKDLHALIRLGQLHINLASIDSFSRHEHYNQAREYLKRAKKIAPENEAVQNLLAGLKN